MSLVEMLVALAVVLILISASLRVGRYIRIRSSIQLTKSALAVIDAALEQYYSDLGMFPFGTDLDDDGVSDPFLMVHLQGLLNGTVNAADLLEKDGSNIEQSFASSAGLYWFLHRSTNSRSIIEAITPSLVEVRHPQEARQELTVVSGGVTYDLPRFVDPWGMSLRYRYVPTVGVFPRITSAGPDRIFGTPDDIENK